MVAQKKDSKPVGASAQAAAQAEAKKTVSSLPLCRSLIAVPAQVHRR